MIRSRFRIASLFVAALLASSSALAAPGDDAQHRKEAQVLFNEGVKQAQAGDGKSALASFRAAYEKYPSFRVLYNIGQLCERMGDPACAVRSYEQYLRDGGADVDKKRREAVETSVKALAAKLAMVTVKSNVSGADVVVDDLPSGRTPMTEPMPLNPGSHRIVVKLGDRTGEKKIDAVAGEPLAVQVDVPTVDANPVVLVPMQDPNPTTTPPRDTPRSEPTKQQSSKFPVVPWVVTGGLAVVTIVSGVLTASAYGTYQDKKDQFPVTKSELDDAQGTARTWFIVTSVFGVATVAMAGVSTYLTLAPKKTGSTSVSPRVAIGLGGLSLTGTLP